MLSSRFSGPHSTSSRRKSISESIARLWLIDLILSSRSANSCPPCFVVMFMAQDFSKAQDYYKILGVEYDATEESIRTSYLRLALKWHPDKHNDATAATLKFQEINEAYRVLSDPLMRHEYDMQGTYVLKDYSITDYLKCFKSMILTCNGLGISSFANQ